MDYTVDKEQFKQLDRYRQYDTIISYCANSLKDRIMGKNIALINFNIKNEKHLCFYEILKISLVCAGNKEIYVSLPFKQFHNFKRQYGNKSYKIRRFLSLKKINNLVTVNPQYYMNKCSVAFGISSDVFKDIYNVYYKKEEKNNET